MLSGMFSGSLVVKDLALSLLWLSFHLRAGNFRMLVCGPKKKKGGGENPKPKTKQTNNNPLGNEIITEPLIFSLLLCSLIKVSYVFGYFLEKTRTHISS